MTGELRLGPTADDRPVKAVRRAARPDASHLVAYAGYLNNQHVVWHIYRRRRTVADLKLGRLPKKSLIATRPSIAVCMSRSKQSR